jgi:putative phage-type endonuclease
MAIEIVNDVKIIGTRETLAEEEFRKLRGTYIGGSDAGSILGMSPYSSPLSVYCEKKGISETEDNEFMLWGRLLEPVIRNQFGSRHPEFAITEDPQLYRHDSLPWLGGTIDGRIQTETGELGLEVKTGSEYSKEWGDGEVPDRYYAQVQHYMALLDLPGFWVVALLGRKMVERYVPRNDAFIAYLLEMEKRFWETYVVPGRMPDPIGIDIDGELLSLIYKDAVEQDPTPDLGPDMGTMVEQYRVAKEHLDEQEKLVAGYNQRIKAAMGEAKIARAGPFQLTWSRWTQKRFNTKAFANDHPDLVEQYKTQEVNTGRLTVKLSDAPRDQE